MNDAARLSSVLERFGAWSASLTSDGIPERARVAAKYQTLNMVAAAYAAHDDDNARAVGEAVRNVAGEGGRCTVVATGAKLPPVEAAYVNAAFSMAHDFDDIVWMGHTCHSAVFASLAVAEHEGVSTRDFVDAVVVANEIGGRIGASCILGPLNGQMWSFVHLVSAAAGTARILRLDAARTTNALAIALAQPNFPLQPGFMLPSSKLLTASTPTAIGIRAAYLARAGITGDRSIVEDRRGFWSRFAFLPLPGMTEDLGRFWTCETLGIKTYPGCYYFQTAFTAIEAILGRHPSLAPEDVASVRIDSTKLGCEASRFAAEYAFEGTQITPVGIDFDLALAAAVMFHARSFTADEHAPQWLAEHTDALRRWRERIEVHHDPALTARVIESANAVGAGRTALGSIHAADVLRLVRRYRDEYRSTLITPEEAVRWVRVAAGAWRRRGQPRSEKPAIVRLEFPNRVTVRFRDGHEEREQVDLPVGSLASPSVEHELRRKVTQALRPRLGVEHAERVFALAMRIETVELADFVAAVRGGGEGGNRKV